MRQAAVGRIGAELGLVLLVLLSLLTAHVLVKKAYEAVPERAEEVAAVPARTAPTPNDPLRPTPAIVVPESAPVAIVEDDSASPAPEPDPTAVAIDRIRGLVEAQRATARDADARTVRQFEETTRLETERHRWSQRTALVKERSRQLDRLVADLEKALGAAEQQRVSLTRVREEQARALAAAQTKGNDHSYAVAPYKGTSGTWRRPIVIDCSASSVQVLPDGRVYGSADLGPIPNARAISLVYEVRKKAAELQDQDSPDGAPSVAYILFLVRPDGVRHYYEARTLLESSGIAFGYELIGQDWVVDVPEVHRNPAPDSPTSMARADRPANGVRGSKVREPGAADDLFVWPADSLRAPGGRNSAGPLAEFPGSPGTPRNSGSTNRAGIAVLEPADLLEPRIRQVPDPRRQNTTATATATAPELAEGYLEIIPGQAGRPDAGSGAASSAVRPATRANAIGNGPAGTPGSQGQGQGTLPLPTLRSGDQSGGRGQLAALPVGSLTGLPSSPVIRPGSGVGSSHGTGTVSQALGGGGASLTDQRGLRGGANGGPVGSNPTTVPKGLEEIPPLGVGNDPESSAVSSDLGMPAVGTGGDGAGELGGTGNGGKPGQIALGGLAASVGESPGSGNGGKPGQIGLGGMAGRSDGTTSAATAANWGITSPGSGSATSPSARSGSGTGDTTGQIALGGSAGAASMSSTGANTPGSGGSPGQIAFGGTSGGASSSAASGSGMGGGSQGQTAFSGSAGGSSSRAASGSGSGGSPGQAASDGSAASPSSGGSMGSAGSHWLSMPSGSAGLPPKVSDEWLDLVVACQPHGVTIQPGGYRLSRTALTSGTLLIDRLRAIVQHAGLDERGRIRRPRIRFVVEAGGQEAFWLARRQTSFVGLDWPATLQLAESIRWDGWPLEEVRR
jgi:hypothetical protein